MTETFSY